ncbi:hypothetical protein BTJ40_21875 [Microbulbifer sp. A4B17]|uniref:hypothetical protein n=1 Tax=Microbulbifer sp. A4B17 TaxID=359370 RepID=UPI000D52B2E2|nr:hypothetical protein [Microbulbifer sp. A4B17]AWF83253.1 hypothetical protein BTJ40_21875 [Microbulbifer sp. A4B17]
MEFVELYADDGVSLLRKRVIDSPQREPLGNYSTPYPAKQVQFREFTGGQRFDWHCAPQAQFILYLEGRVKLTTSSGAQHTFAPGDILLANDLQGEGHISESLSPGRAAIVVLSDSPQSH